MPARALSHEEATRLMVGAIFSFNSGRNVDQHTLMAHLWLPLLRELLRELLMAIDSNSPGRVVRSPGRPVVQ